MGLHTRAAGALIAATAAVLGLAACGTSTPTGTAPPSTTMSASMTMPMSTATSTAAAPPIATDAVTIKGFAFSPASITVRVGTTVTWTNQDQDAHTVTSTTKAFGSQALDTGARYTFTFTRPGTYDYLCTIHPFMTATVVVTS